MAFRGGEGTVNGTARTLTVILGLTDAIFAPEIDVRANPANAASAFLGKSNLTTTTNRAVLLQAGNSFSFVAGQGAQVSTDDIFAVGTANDIIHIAVVG